MGAEDVRGCVQSLCISVVCSWCSMQARFNLPYNSRAAWPLVSVVFWQCQWHIQFLIAWEGLCLSKHSEISSCSFHGLRSCSHPRFLLNPKEQFVKIQIVAVADGTDVALGEATVPIADPMSESMNSWCGASSCEELWWMLSGIETEATTKMQLLDRISKHLLADLEV